MSRIFFSLAVLALAMLAVVIGVGLTLGDLKGQLVVGRALSARRAQLQASPRPTAEERAELATIDRKLAGLAELRASTRLHILLGVATALLVILVNSIAVTYFIGTGRWCREVVETYGLDPQLHQRSLRLKRRSFPAAVAGMVAALVVSALGAAADPGTLLPNTESWVTPHLIAALVGAALIAWAFFAQWLNIVENHAVIDEVVAEVARIRAERGLEG